MIKSLFFYFRICIFLFLGYVSISIKDMGEVGMSVKTKVDRLLEVLTEGPLLPGGVREHYNVCGKSGCRCKDPENPVLHGPYLVLSWTLAGNGSSITIDPRGKAAAEKMVSRFRKAKELVNDIALEYANELRKHGVQKIKRDAPVLSVGTVTPSITAVRTKRAEESRDAWKGKALKRQAELEKNRVCLRDLQKSRANWRGECLALRKQKTELAKKLETAEWESSELNARIEAIERQTKKNGKC